MRTIQTAAVATLFLLLPHHAPFADSNGPQAAVEVEAVEAEAQPGVSLRKAASAERSDGFVFSTPEKRQVGKVWSPSSGHREADGYSWSTVRSERRAASERGGSR